MNSRYLYQAGDEVRHVEKQEIKGTIIQLLSYDSETGLPCEDQDPDHPHYRIAWEGEDFVGFEAEQLLIPGYVYPMANLVVRKLYTEDNDLWVKTTNECRAEYKDYL